VRSDTDSDTSLTVDASSAGAGNLEISVSANDINVPNFVKQEQAARFSVSYTPQVVDTHMISVKFNGDVVPGKSLSCAGRSINELMRCIKMLTTNFKLKMFPAGCIKISSFSEV